MKKIFVLMIFSAIFYSCTTVVPVERAVEDIAWDTIDMISDDATPVIAVYNLRDLSGSDEVNNMIVTRLTTELANAVHYEDREIIIVSRQTFNELFLEQNFILSDLSDQTKQLEIGKLLGADLILTGDLTKIEGDVFNINTQLIDIESGEILGGNTFDFWVNLPKE